MANLAGGAPYRNIREVLYFSFRAESSAKFDFSILFAVNSAMKWNERRSINAGQLRGERDTRTPTSVQT